MQKEDNGYGFDDVRAIKATMDKKGKTKALLIHAENTGDEHFSDDLWVPYSVLHSDSEVYREGDVGTLILKTWWVEKQGWL